jgi:hypothetical protein
MSSVGTVPNPDVVYFNGIDAETGTYAVDPLDLNKLARRIRAPVGDRGVANISPEAAARGDERRAYVPFGMDQTNLTEVGWGIVFSDRTPDAVRDALENLIDHRRQQAGDLLKTLDYEADEGLRDWYLRHEIAIGTFEPTRVPYYLLLVGSPAEIPFEFQYLLGLEYAVGRLSFDSPQEYEAYAKSVVELETRAAVSNKKEIVYWGTQHDGDPATTLSASLLIEPLANGLPGTVGRLKNPIHTEVQFSRRLYCGVDANRAALLDTLHADKPPAFLFTASHGMCVKAGKQNQSSVNGGLLCQDWPGFGSIQKEHFVTASDINDDAKVGGMLAFFFACFSAGTPDRDEFLMDLSQAGQMPPLAPAPFIAALPRRLMSHPNGSALAVIGHVDRAWGFSIQPPKMNDSQIGTFRNSLGFLLKGAPVGHVMSQQFSQRYATLSTVLADAIAPAVPENRKLTDRQLVTAWLERNDAQNYIVLGDPAVRLRPDSMA